MYFPTVLLASAACVNTVFAQAPIAFASVPPVVVAGNSYNITWGGGDGTPVTITLRKGNPSAVLQTIETLTSNATGSWYIWNVSTLLPSATDYALQITQGQNEINYSGTFTLVGGSGPSSISYSGTMTMTMNSTMPMNMTKTGASTGTGSPMSRNMTFSSMTLDATGRGSSSSSLGPGTAPTAVQTTSGASQLVQSGITSLVVLAAIMSLQ